MPNRDIQVDLLKTVAILSVIAIHVTSYGWGLYPAGSFAWVANMFWASLTRAAVPLFLMCSGALFLDPQRVLPLKRLYGKYLPRVYAAMVAWAYAYKIYELAGMGRLGAAALWHALKEVLLFNQEFHFYYIHMIILVYACLPVLKALTAKADKKELAYALAVWFAFMILYPTAVHFWPFHLIEGFPLQWMGNMTYAALGYLVLGFYLKFAAPPGRGVSLALLGGGFCIVFFGTWVMCIRLGSFYDGFLGGMTAGVAMMAAGIFGLCRGGCGGDEQPAESDGRGSDEQPMASEGRGGAGSAAAREPLFSRLSAWVSKASFCVYLAHVFFLYTFEKAGLTVGAFHPALSAPVMTAAIFLCSCVVYTVLARIPFVNKWLI